MRTTHPAFGDTIGARMGELLLVQPDRRGRVSLGPLLRDEQYKVSVGASGQIILEPAVVLTKTELRLASDEAFWARVTAAAAQPAEEFELEEL